MIDYFNAYSGNALSIGEKEELIKQYGYESFVSYKDNQNKISYFCLDKEWQNHKAKGAGTHFMIDKDGTIYQCASLYKTTWHVGARKKGITITNNTSIGIEVVAWYDDKTHKWYEATREQKIALRKIIKILLKHYNLTENDIYEHDKIANKTAGEGANLYIKGEK